LTLSDVDIVKRVGGERALFEILSRAVTISSSTGRRGPS
jgi:hypothetical protein